MFILSLYLFSSLSLASNPPVKSASLLEQDEMELKIVNKLGEKNDVSEKNESFETNESLMNYVCFLSSDSRRNE